MIIGKTIKETITNLNNLEYEDRLKEVVSNKESIYSQKIQSFKECDNVSVFTGAKAKTKIQSDKKEDALKQELNADVIQRTIVGNSCWVLDSHSDVHVDGCWDKTLKEDESLFYHTKNHSRNIDDRVGRALKTYVKNISTKTLGVDSDIEEVEALVMDTEIHKALDAKMFTQYALSMVNQHSVGMRYVSLKLALNIPQEEEEYKVWVANIDKIVNKQDAINLGFFWIVEECKLIEISAVTRGSNHLTPTIEEESKTTNNNNAQKTFISSLANNLVSKKDDEKGGLFFNHLTF